MSFDTPGPLNTPLSNEEIAFGTRSLILRKLRHHLGRREQLPPEEAAVILSNILRMLGVPNPICMAVNDAISPPPDGVWHYKLGPTDWLIEDLIKLVEEQ